MEWSKKGDHTWSGLGFRVCHSNGPTPNMFKWNSADRTVLAEGFLEIRSLFLVGRTGNQGSVAPLSQPPHLFVQRPLGIFFSESPRSDKSLQVAVGSPVAPHMTRFLSPILYSGMQPASTDCCSLYPHWMGEVVKHSRYQPPLSFSTSTNQLRDPCCKKHP